MKFIFKRNRTLFFFTVIMSLLFALATVGFAKVLEYILDSVTTGNWQLFNKMLFVVPLYMVIVGLILIFSGMLTKKFIAKTIQGLRKNAFDGIFSREPEIYHSVNTADYISALTNDIKTVEESALVPFMQSVQYFLMFLATVAALFYYSPVIAGIMFLCLIIMYLVPTALGKSISRGQNRLSGNFAMFTANLKDQLSGYDVIRSFRLTENTTNKFTLNNNILTQSKYSVDLLSAISESLAQTLAMSSQVVIMLVSGYLVLRGNMTAGVLIALIQLSGSFVQPVAVIIQSMSVIKGALPVVERVVALGEKQSSAFAGTKMPTFHQNIALNNVSFGYKPDQTVLSDVSFTFQKGRKYAMIGESGCGKSTLIKLLTANYGGYLGEVTMDGMDIRSADLDKLLDKISVIHQNIYMFDETIEDNIKLHRDFGAKEWEKALAISGVNKFLPQMENGINTDVGENGANLSGGQRQRIAVARAIIQNKPILILDEGTSAIDSQTAYDIETALLAVPELTMITITHSLNPDLLRQYDQVLYINNGRIAEAGGYEKLTQCGEGFCEFLQIQKKEAVSCHI